MVVRSSTHMRFSTFLWMKRFCITRTFSFKQRFSICLGSQGKRMSFMQKPEDSHVYMKHRWILIFWCLTPNFVSVICEYSSKKIFNSNLIHASPCQTACKSLTDYMSHVSNTVYNICWSWLSVVLAPRLKIQSYNRLIIEQSWQHFFQVLSPHRSICYRPNPCWKHLSSTPLSPILYSPSLLISLLYSTVLYRCYLKSRLDQ